MVPSILSLRQLFFPAGKKEDDIVANARDIKEKEEKDFDSLYRSQVLFDFGFLISSGLSFFLWGREAGTCHRIGLRSK